MKTIGHDIGTIILYLDDDLICMTIGRVIIAKIIIISDDEVEIHQIIITDE